jgi:UDP-N-acetylmuramate--alanine ligase
MSILSNTHFFFIGVGGAGMSAIAQYLSGSGKQVRGSDRLFASAENDYIRQQLEREGIECFLQDGSGIDAHTEAVIVSTAIEDTNVEVAKAKSMGIPIILRADLLAAICESRPTVAIAGTSGKSTVTAMLFHILHTCGLGPSLITGAGLASLQEDGRIGNAFVGEGKWLLIEADESDGTLVKYKPQIGLLLSIDKDHKELDELHGIFRTFRSHTLTHFVTNRSHALAAAYSTHEGKDFGDGTRFEGRNFAQEGFSISFDVADAQTDSGSFVHVVMPTIGRHNMENALACMAVADLLGVSVEDSARALSTYAGIYRRHQCLGEAGGITVIDDYAHNPAKIAASVRACQPVAPKLLAWFQPHGYGPTRFIRRELVEEIAAALRPDDEIWMSEIYYAGGTAVKDISAADLIADLQAKGVKAYFVADRKELFEQLVPTLSSGTVLLLMGARDPGLEKFGREVMAMVKTGKA